MGKAMRTDCREIHTFVIPAYGESPYLPDCIASLRKQEYKSQIIMACAEKTPYLEAIAAKEGIPLFSRGGANEIASDWNYALSLSTTPLVTLAHQDDIYLPGYTRGILAGYKRAKKDGRPLIVFSDYAELHESVPKSDRPECGEAANLSGGTANATGINDESVFMDSPLLRVKHLLLMPLVNPVAWKSKWIRRRILSLGSAICCPSVTYVKDELPQPLFQSGMRSNIDWQAWERLSSMDGSFVYVKRPLCLHRIHEDSTTNHLLEQSARKTEDLCMFRKFWPEPVARVIEFFYKANEKSAAAK